jgi:hypothetical protein
MKKKRETNGLMTFANIALVSATAKILQIIALVRQVGGLSRRKYSSS